MSSKTGANFFRRTDFKMTLWYILTFMLSTMIIFGFLYLRLRQQFIKEVDRFILDETEELTDFLARNSNQEDLLDIFFKICKKVFLLTDFLARNSNQEDLLTNFEKNVKMRTHYPIYFRIMNGSGNILYISKNFKWSGNEVTEKILVNARKGRDTRENIYPPGGRRPFRFISTPIDMDGNLTYIIQIGTHLKFVKKNLSNLRNNLCIALSILFILGSLGGWFLARKSLLPIGYIASKAQRITSKNLDERLTPRGKGDEMDDLIGTINGMIARLEGSFKRMAEFTADASHELKTPICAMRGEAEVLLSKERPAEEYQEGLAHFIEQFDHLNHMINDLILLSKFDSPQVELKMDSLRLDLLIKDLCNLFQILSEENKIALEMGTMEEITVLGD